MLLREFDQSNDFISDLENILNLFLRDYNKQGSPAKIPYEALNNWLQKNGSYGSVNRQIIDQVIEKSDTLGKIISNYDGQGITLSTDAAAPDDTAQAQPDLEKTDQGISKTTQQAASRAAEKSLDN
jgi:hypothetical protein